MFSFLNAYLQLSFRQFILVFISEADVELSNIYSSVKQPKAISIMSEKMGEMYEKQLKCHNMYHTHKVKHGEKKRNLYAIQSPINNIPFKFETTKCPTVGFENVEKD